MAKFTIVKAADIASARLASAGQRAGADSGDPQIAVQSVAPEAIGNLGIWECQPGGWPVINRPDTEFTYIISGRARLTDDSTGEVTEITGGDLVVLPPGWTGRWDVLEPVRKIYAIY
ncbi:cupin [Burkholderia sp. SFA1]|uniref:cupin domain-containing protein n=1 Tax=unclassified Caballeronia TaxID=2646786 RepID=UPI001F167595|nr:MULTISPECIES: cupin domain-containing protein [unclassified Caballeronia]MCE4543975.1 cupin domain-containing protein [Caballeronia sp. PC1]MCE4571126.1 cupin domain-containing protein [Caballeronia sp. CLC5]BBP98957.1 cupin [Burkholderia sp. SFA1]